MLSLVVAQRDYDSCGERIQNAPPEVDIFEWRLDRLDTFDPEKVQKCCALTTRPFIFTGRQTSLHPQYVDVDLSQEVPPEQKIILSFHDWSPDPIDLDALAAKMRQTPAHFYKIAKKVSSTEEALRFLLKRKKLGDKFILIPMCEEENIRLLHPVIGNPIEYAAYSPEERTAPGQILVRDWIEHYDYKRLSPATQIYALIGNPVSQSPSHITHNATFAKNKRDALFVKLRITSLEEFFPLATQFPIRGMSVTIPFKEKVQPYLARIDPEAAEIGAVNTLVLEEGGYVGYNTDGKGALDVIEKRFPAKGKRFILIGAGGSARAIAFEARKRGAEVLLLARRIEQANSVAAALDCKAGDLSQLEKEIASHCDLLINCTPATIEPPQGILYMDLTPTPRTDMKSNEISGYEMFLAQATYQFAHWK